MSRRWGVGRVVSTYVFTSTILLGQESGNLVPSAATSGCVLWQNATLFFRSTLKGETGETQAWSQPLCNEFWQPRCLLMNIFPLLSFFLKRHLSCRIKGAGMHRLRLLFSTMPMLMHNVIYNLILMYHQINGITMAGYVLQQNRPNPSVRINCANVTIWMLHIGTIGSPDHLTLDLSKEWPHISIFFSPYTMRTTN